MCVKWPTLISSWIILPNQMYFKTLLLVLTHFWNKQTRLNYTSNTIYGKKISWNSLFRTCVTEASLPIGTFLSNKHISLVRQHKVAFILVTLVIKYMTFRSLSKGGLLLMAGKCILSLTLHYYNQQKLSM